MLSYIHIETEEDKRHTDASRIPDEKPAPFQQILCDKLFFSSA